MMMQSTRALMDQLMGKDRNKEPSERRERKWTDRDVCENFLCGFCCHDLFTNTKSDLGFCTKDHDEECQAAFRKEPAATQCRLERAFLRHLHDQIRSVDQRIRRGKERGDKPEGKEGEAVGPYAAEINLKNDAIRVLQQQAEKLGEDGKMDALNDVMAKLDTLKKEKEALEAKNKASTTPYVDSQGQSMCEVCGVWRSADMEDLRTKNHFAGKQHQGFELIRKKIEELEQKEGVGLASSSSDKPERRKSRSPDRDRRKSSDRERRDRGRDRDRDRSSRRDRSRSRDRSRDKKKSKSRDRARKSSRRSRSASD